MDRALSQLVRARNEKLAREVQQMERRLEEMREQLRQNGWSRLPDILPAPTQLDPAVVHAEFLGPDLLDPPLEQWAHLHGVWAGAADRDPEELSAYVEVASQEFALGMIAGADMFDADSFTGGEQ